MRFLVAIGHAGSEGDEDKGECESDDEVLASCAVFSARPLHNFSGMIGGIWDVGG